MSPGPSPLQTAQLADQLRAASAGEQPAANLVTAVDDAVRRIPGGWLMVIGAIALLVYLTSKHGESEG